MAEAVARFSCDTCGKQFKWKPELAGRKARCACGADLTVPRESPVVEEDYDLAPTPAVPVQPVTTFTRPAGISYATAQVQGKPGVDSYIFDQTKDLHIPLALIAVGTLVSFAEVLFRLPFGAKSLGPGFALVGIGMTFNTVVMLAGLFIAAKVRGLAFGPFWIALLKLCGISIAPGAAMTLVTLALTPLGLLGALIGWIVSLVLYFALFGVLFDLDESDTWFCVILIFGLKLLTVFLILRMMG